ncbi:hypothetical protein MAUB1S_09675 [Mycolicibacterium aubagnense]
MSLTVQSQASQSSLRRVPPPTIHLGFFDGEHLSRSRGYDEAYGALQAVLSLITIIFALFGVALVLGVL